MIVNNNNFVRDNNQSGVVSITPTIKDGHSGSKSTMNSNGKLTSKGMDIELSSYRNRNRSVTRNNRKSSSLVKSLDLDLDVDNVLEMRPVQGFYGGSMNISNISDSKNSSGSGNSSESFSTAATVPMG